MFLRHAQNGRMVEVLSLKDLFNPNHTKLVGRFHAGEELQDAESFTKDELAFPSGEALPQCWIDADYRGHAH
ncbi:MAG: acetyltransferase [Gammaproteobacteria bacterium]|nr:acetyltransferase [Gammaproteobacteria bacterium]